jgi:hypothetical protein
MTSRTNWINSLKTASITVGCILFLRDSLEIKEAFNGCWDYCLKLPGCDAESVVMRTLFGDYITITSRPHTMVGHP